ncbi:MAG: PorV/PorQ family protein [Candidatus Neomarinimicrobiota bacterium]
MKNNTIKLFLGGILIASTLFAGTIRSSGTAGAAQLLIPVGAENIAVSNANGATVSGVEALFQNPAGLAKYAGSAQALAGTMTYIADIKVTNFGLLSNFGKIGTMGLSVKSLDFGDIPITTFNETEGTGASFSPRFMTIGVTYAKSFSDRVQFGVNFKIVSETIVNTKASGLAVDLGVQYKFPEMPLYIGVVLKNLGSRMEYRGPDLEQQLVPDEAESGSLEERFRIKAEEFDLPSQFDISLTYEVIPGLGLMSTFTQNSFSANTGSFAAKYSFKDFMWVAAGTQLGLVSSSDQPDDVEDAEWDDWTDSVWGYTFGAGVAIPLGDFKVGVGYSYRSVTSYFENNSLFQLTVDF